MDVHQSIKNYEMNEAKQRVGIANLNCPMCQYRVSNRDPMFEHLLQEHGVGKRRAQFLVEKLIEWKLGIVDPIVFRRVIDLVK